MQSQVCEGWLILAVLEAGSWRCMFAMHSSPTERKAWWRQERGGGWREGGGGAYFCCWTAFTSADFILVP